MCTCLFPTVIRFVKLEAGQAGLLSRERDFIDYVTDYVATIYVCMYLLGKHTHTHAYIHRSYLHISLTLTTLYKSFHLNCDSIINSLYIYIYVCTERKNKQQQTLSTHSRRIFLFLLSLLYDIIESQLIDATRWMPKNLLTKSLARQISCRYPKLINTIFYMP